MKFLTVLVFVGVVLSTIVGQKGDVYQVASLAETNVPANVSEK